MNERRAAERRNVVDSDLVTVDLAFQSGALLVDISETGMGVQALSSAPSGNTTSLHFDLPERGGRVEAIGRIAWTDSSGRMGILFEQIAENGRQRLAQWLSGERRPPAGASNGSQPSWPPAYMRDEIAALRRDVVTQKLEGDAALAFVVERTRSVTRATGAAIALEENGMIVCRASSGNAPAVGAHLDPNAGLSGECVRTGEPVRCEDTETDPRADRLVCRKLDLRSIVIVPIRIQGRTAGVLEAFSSRMHAFQGEDVLLLRRVSDLVAGIAARQLDASQGIPSSPLAALAATELEPLPVEPETKRDDSPLMMDEILALDVPRVVAEPPPSILDEILFAPPTPIISRREVPAEAEATVEATVEAKIKQGPIAPEVRPAENITEPFATAGIGETRVPTMPRPAPSVQQVERRAAPARKPEPPPTVKRVTMPAAPLVDEVPASRVSPIAASAPAPAAAPVRPRPVPVVEDLRVSPRSEASEQIFASMESEPTSGWTLKITGATILLGVLVFGGWQVWRMVATPRGTPMDRETKVTQPVPTPSEVMNSATPGPPAAAVPPGATVVPVSPTPAPPKATPATAMPADMTKKLTTAPAAAKSAAPPVVVPPAPAVPNTEDVPPVIGLVSRGEGMSISSVLSAPVATPSLDRPAISQITGGKLIQKIDPVYPSSAMGVRGEVILKAVVAKDGRVKTVRVVSGQPVLAQAAAVAVKRWRYQPFVLNGVPIEVENTVVVNFKSARP